MTDKIVVLSTASSADEAEKIARKLVEDRLAACVNLVPGMRSFYRWKGTVEDSPECLLIIKSSRDRFEALGTALEKMHSYEVPEVIALPVVDGAIVDSNPFHRRAWEQYNRRFGIETDEAMHRRMYGRRNDDIVLDFLGPHLTPDEVRAHGAAKERLYREMIGP